MPRNKAKKTQNVTRCESILFAKYEVKNHQDLIKIAGAFVLPISLLAQHQHALYLQ